MGLYCYSILECMQLNSRRLQKKFIMNNGAYYVKLLNSFSQTVKNHHQDNAPLRLCDGKII